jgi:hypothetical protein
VGRLCDRYVAPVREDTAAPPSLVKVVVHPRGSNHEPQTLGWRPQPPGIRACDALDWARMIVKRYEGTLPPPTTLRLSD